MAVITLDQLRTDALRCADMVSGSLVSQAELDRHINKSGGELWGLLATRYEDYLTVLSPTTASVASGASSFTIPSDFLKLVGVDMQQGSGWVQLDRFGLKDRERLNRATFPFLPYSSCTVRYDVVGKDVYLLPEAQAPGSYRYRYVRAWTTLASSTDSIDVPNGWEEYISVDVAIKCLEKGELDHSSQTQRKIELRERIKEEATNRNALDQEFIGDDHFGSWGRW